MTRAAPCDNLTEGHQYQRFNEMELPSCAVIGGRGTVIVRIMGACEVCSRPVYWPQDMSSRRSCLLKCELCSRTSFYCRCSDCDSVLDRPYKRSAARSRDFNVCAAICLLLLAGGLTPRSSAAPVGKMDRTNRTNSTDWENPCDYDSNDTIEYTSKIPENIASEANITLRKVKQYQDVFANKTYTFQRYEQLLAAWPRNYEWFRNISWVAKLKLLPSEHTFNTTYPDEKIEELMKSENDLQELLPHMYRGLKLVMASWGELITKMREMDHDHDVTEKMSDTYYKMKTVLCQFYNLMRALNLPTDTTFDEEDLPKYTGDSDKYLYIALVFRDSVYYLEYLRQFFSIMARIKP